MNNDRKVTALEENHGLTLRFDIDALREAGASLGPIESTVISGEIVRIFSGEKFPTPLHGGSPVYALVFTSNDAIRSAIIAL